MGGMKVSRWVGVGGRVVGGWKWESDGWVGERASGWVGG